MTLWDLKSKYFDSGRRLFPFNLILLRELRNLQELLAKSDLNGSYVLDVGTGTGTCLRLFPAVTRVVAMDSSFAMIAQARSKAKGHFIVGDACFLPFRRETFGVVSAVGVLEYQKDQRQFLNELKRALRPEGQLVLTCAQPNILNFLRLMLAHPLHLLTLRRFQKLVRSTGYSIIMMRRSLIQRQTLLRNSL